MDLNPIEKQRVLQNVGKLSGKRILIVGDVGLDEYLLGQVRRISPEAPVPVLEVESEELRLGLALNVAQNILSLGGSCQLVSIVGNDSGAEKLRELSQRSGIDWSEVRVDQSRPTTRKTRVMAGPHHIVRVDYELRKFVSQEIESSILKSVERALPACDGVILQDYAKGLVTATLVKDMVQLCKQAGKRLFVDPHRLNPGSFYKGVDLIKPNFDEALSLSGLSYDELRDHPNRVQEVGRSLQSITQAEYVVMTRGREGMSIFSRERVTTVPTFARKVFDVTGAGDTVIAALSLGIVGGLSVEAACEVANFAAGVVVGKVGCVPCYVEELREYIQSASSLRHKLT